MPLKLSDIVATIETVADPSWAFDWDRVGLQVGDPDRTVSRALVSLDWSAALVERALAIKAQLVLCHHPLIWNPLTSLTPKNPSARIALRLAESGTAFYACHTQWDCAPGGVNDALAEALGLQDVAAFGEAARAGCLKLAVFCPEGSEDRIVDAASAAGAGQIGEYSRCAFISRGIGTFRGSEVSSPAIGQAGRVESVSETRVEMIVNEDIAAQVEDAIRNVHPYEEPAIDFFRMRESSQMPIGRIGVLREPLRLEELARHADSRLDSCSCCWGSRDSLISTVAVVGGAGGSLWRAAASAGADVLLAGEVKQDEAVDASESGMAIIAAGHYATEQPGVRALAERLADAAPEVEWNVFEPVPGCSGRPFHDPQSNGR